MRELEAVLESSDPDGFDAALYVSPEGDDAWSGRLPEPDAVRSDGPFATIGRAMEEARALAGSITVFIREGTYSLEEPLVFGPEDGGSLEESVSIVYAAYGGEEVVLSGGQVIEGWEAREIGGRTLWATHVPEVQAGRWYFRQLFVNGRRSPRPRLPRRGFYRIASIPGGFSGGEWNHGQDRFEFHAGDLDSSWRNPEEIEVVALHFWVESRLPVESIDEEESVASFRKHSTYRLSDDFQDRGARYYVENVFEALRPGEWYLERSTGLLYYYPQPGEDIEGFEAIAPRLAELVRFEGRPDSPVENLHLNGITLSHTEFHLPEGKVEPGKWASTAGFGQAAAGAPAAITLRESSGCSVRDCTVRSVGTYGIEVGPGSDRTLVAENLISDLGAGGVKVEQGSSRSAIVANEIAAGGRIFHSAVGVLVRDSGGNAVARNHIHDLFYTGVSVGWVWGYGESSARDNAIEHNHIHDIGQGMLNDMGGIYTLGISTGSVIRYNHIHDVRSDGYGGWGIYLDEGTTDMLVEKNLVYRTRTGGFHQHYGRENVVRNNVFALSEQGQIQRTRVEEHVSFRFERNAVYFCGGPVLTGSWERPAALFNRNLYFDESGAELDFSGRTLEEWQELGMDRDSLVADPCFEDSGRGNFTLLESSPLFRLGFEPFDVPYLRG